MPGRLVCPVCYAGRVRWQQCLAGHGPIEASCDNGECQAHWVDPSVEWTEDEVGPRGQPGAYMTLDSEMTVRRWYAEFEERLRLRREERAAQEAAGKDGPAR